MVEYGVTKCKYCIHFAYLAEKVEGTKKDGWCTRWNDFIDSNDPNCSYFEPRLKKEE
jgi:hypothetical protein